MRVYMMGYLPNGYRLWDPAEGRVVSGKDVIFNEVKFSHDSENWYCKYIKKMKSTGRNHQEDEG